MILLPKMVSCRLYVCLKPLTPSPLPYYKSPLKNYCNSLLPGVQKQSHKHSDFLKPQTCPCYSPTISNSMNKIKNSLKTYIVWHLPPFSFLTPLPWLNIVMYSRSLQAFLLTLTTENFLVLHLPPAHTVVHTHFLPSYSLISQPNLRFKSHFCKKFSLTPDNSVLYSF